MTDGGRLSTLRAWCTDNGIRIDSRLELAEDPHGGIAVYNYSGSSIDSPITREFTCTLMFPMELFIHLRLPNALLPSLWLFLHTTHTPVSTRCLRTRCSDRNHKVVAIPKHAILSVRSCSLSDNIPFVPYGNGAHCGLALALYTEL